jgi:hypothetical protein
MGATIVDGQDLDVFVIVAPVNLVFETHVREVHVSIEVRQIVLECPVLDLSWIAVGAAVAVAIAFVQPLLVLALELVIEHHSFNARIAFRKPLRDAQVGPVDLGVMFELALAFEACVELLTGVVVAVSMRLQQLPAAVGENDRDIPPAIQSNGVDQALLTQVAEVAIARVGFATGVIPQITSRDHSKRSNGRKRPCLGAAQRVFAFAWIVDDVTFQTARQGNALHERVARIKVPLARIGPPGVVAIARVGF